MTFPRPNITPALQMGFVILRQLEVLSVEENQKMNAILYDAATAEINLETAEGLRSAALSLGLSFVGELSRCLKMEHDSGLFGDNAGQTEFDPASVGGRSVVADAVLSAMDSIKDNPNDSGT